MRLHGTVVLAAFISRAEAQTPIAPFGPPPRPGTPVCQPTSFEHMSRETTAAIAMGTCRSQDSIITSLHTVADERSLGEIVPPGASVWIGLVDTSSVEDCTKGNRVWEWADGTPSDDYASILVLPSGTAAGDCDNRCAVFSGDATGNRLTAVPCDESHSFVCGHCDTPFDSLAAGHYLWTVADYALVMHETQSMPAGVDYYSSVCLQIPGTYTRHDECFGPSASLLVALAPGACGLIYSQTDQACYIDHQPGCVFVHAVRAAAAATMPTYVRSNSNDVWVLPFPPPPSPPPPAPAETPDISAGIAVGKQTCDVRRHTDTCNLHHNSSSRSTTIRLIVIAGHET